MMRAPFPELGVLRFLAGDRIADDRVAEMVDDCCDGKCTTEPFVQSRLRHLLPPRRCSGTTPPTTTVNRSARIPAISPSRFLRTSGASFEGFAAVQRKSHPGRGYRKPTRPLTVNVSDSTRYVKAGAASTLDALAQNDMAVVKSKMARCDLRDADPAAMPALMAKQVVVQLLAAESD